MFPALTKDFRVSPDQIIYETKIAEELGMGRQPVHIALIILNEEC